MNSTWKTLAWGLFWLCIVDLWPTSCGTPRIPTPPPPGAVEAPAGADSREAAAFYRKKAAEYKTAAETAQAEADRAKVEARQAWCWWSGVSSLVLAAVAFALAFAYPLASFLRIGGWCGLGAGVSLILVGELVPFLGLFAVITAVAIILALVIHHFVAKNAVESWKSVSNATPDAQKLAADAESIQRQKKVPFVKKHIDKMLGK